MVRPLAAFAAVLLGTDRLGAEGQEVCWKCQGDVTGDWTTWDCGFKTGERCLNNLGDWTSWEQCCGVTTTAVAASPVPAPVPTPAPEPYIPVVVSPSTTPYSSPEPAPQPVPVPVPVPPAPVPQRQRSFQPVQQDCNCDWTHGPFGCGAYDGTHCWNACCDKPQCDCSWTRYGGCGVPDGSQCWDFCCIKSTAQCNCAWVRDGGCYPADKDDGSPCWAQCCHVGGGSMTFFLKAAKTFGITGSPGNLSAWAGCVLAVAGFCGLFAVARRSAGGVIRSILERTTLDPSYVTELECPALPMERSFDSSEKPLVLNSEFTADLPPQVSSRDYSNKDRVGDRRSWTGRVLAMAKGVGDWRGKERRDGDFIME